MTTRHRGRVSALLAALVLLTAGGGAAQSPSSGPILLLPPGQVVPPPRPGTPTAFVLPGYDTDKDTRNEWSKKELPDRGPCLWLPPVWGVSSAGARVSAAEKQAVQQGLEKVVAFLKTAPIASPPVGFCPQVAGGSPDIVDEGFALRAELGLGNWPVQWVYRDKPGGRLGPHGELPHGVGFRVNEMPGGGVMNALYSTPYEAVDAQGEFLKASEPSALFQGFPVYLMPRNLDDNYMVIPLNNRPLFRPVRVGRMVSWQVAQLDKDLGRLKGTMDNARRQYDSFFAPAAQTEEEEIIAKRIANERARTPAEQEKIRASRQTEVRAKTQALREQWDVASRPNHPFDVATRRRAQAQARLASLPSAEAQSPACFVELSTDVPDVATVGNPKCSFNLVERNPEYYDRSLPRSAIQIVIINGFSWVAPEGGLPGGRYQPIWADRHALWGLDWQKFRRDVLGATAPFQIATVTPYTGVPRPLPADMVTLAPGAVPTAVVSSPQSPPVAPSGPGALAAPTTAFQPRVVAATGPPTIQTLLPIYRTDQLVEVRFSGMSGRQSDWMAIAVADAPVEQYAEWAYFFKQTSGTHKFSRLLKPGRYEVRVFDEGPAGRSGVKARVQFEVR